jgi:hypothetical protein
MSYTSSTTTVGSSTAVLITAGSELPDSNGQLIRNVGSASVYLGGSAVTSSLGLPVSSTDGIIHVPTTGAEAGDLHGITSAGSTTVVFLTPS